MSGYGRGYYGEAQLARPPRRKRSWFTVVAVLGLGAGVVWLLWPRQKALPNFGTINKEHPLQLQPQQQPQQPQQQSPLVVINAGSVSAPPPVVGAFLKQLEDDASLRGFATVKEYEDSVVASAKQLQAAGTKVLLAPHLQHLAPQLESKRT